MRFKDQAYGVPTRNHQVCNTARTVIPINENWQFRQTDDPDSPYLDTQGLPTQIHLDLLHHGIIADPFIGKQENDVQWVGEKSWTYRTMFDSPLLTRQNAVLVFEGLDTYAAVVLNGTTILNTKNMHTPERVDVTGKLQHGKGNSLEITFESTYLIGKKIVEETPDHKWGCWNGDPSRLAVRKAQYHYGWDWGPTLLTCGPWKPIHLEVYESRISDLYFSTEVGETLESATVVAELDFEGQADQVKFELSIEGKCFASCVEILGPSQTVKASLRTKGPKLWYPRKYGEQPLYLLTATLLENSLVLDTASKVFGLRRAKLVQRELEGAPGTTFIFEINNIPIFCGGSNWIPAHSFQALLDPQKYRDWVRLAADGNQAMLRVWGGGIYENDAFYEACDEMGILVWQDFLFACGNYPAHEGFLDSVRREAIANVKRLRHHPCIVLWAGNNEDYQYRETENLEYDPEDKDPSNWLKSTFPARYIYEKLLKDVVTELVPDTYYHFGSPYGGKATSDPTVGDLHQWNVWHGTQERYQDFDRLSGRFVSEFGMEAFPDMATIDTFLLNGEEDIDCYPQSSTVEFHNKAAGHERRLALYLAENIRYTTEPFGRYVYCTQLIQAEAISTAFRLWKRQWKGPGREYCAGALVWQMNDCWPAISWSIVDHFLRPKLAYFAVMREMEPITIGMKRTVRRIPSDKYTHAYVKAIHEIELWACNLSTQSLKVTVDLRVNDFLVRPETQYPRPDMREIYSTLLGREGSKNTFLLRPNRSTEIARFEVPVSKKDADEESQTIVGATMYHCDTSQLVARAVNWPEPLKHVHLKRSMNIKFKLCMHGEEAGIHLRSYSNPPDWWRAPNQVCMLAITSDMPLKGMRLQVNGGEYVAFEDQGFDVMADETVVVRVWGLAPGEEDRISVEYL